MVGVQVPSSPEKKESLWACVLPEKIGSGNPEGRCLSCPAELTVSTRWLVEARPPPLAFHAPTSAPTSASAPTPTPALASRGRSSGRSSSADDGDCHLQHGGPSSCPCSCSPRRDVLDSPKVGVSLSGARSHDLSPAPAPAPCLGRPSWRHPSSREKLLPLPPRHAKTTTTTRRRVHGSLAWRIR